MSEQHTPGPWRWMENGVSEKGCRCIEIKAHGYWNIASLQSHPSHTYSDAESIANARLISASPELLAALEDAISEYQETGAIWDISKAEAAIAKAKGGKQ